MSPLLLGCPLEVNHNKLYLKILKLRKLYLSDDCCLLGGLKDRMHRAVTEGPGRPVVLGYLCERHSDDFGSDLNGSRYNSIRDLPRKY